MAQKKETAPKEKKTAKKKTTRVVKKKTKETTEYVYPAINIGLVGHVDHGKTTLTERLSGKWTDTHSEEMKRGITIRLGYADTIFYTNPGKEGIESYTTLKEEDGKENTMLRKVCFVDAPGHESLMATMLAGAALMDGALLLIAANEQCPQPQTKEHLMALEIIGIKNLIVVQNKIDLVSKEDAITNYKQIKEFLKGTSYHDAPIIPISAQQGININALIAAIELVIPTPTRTNIEAPLMYVARSFDINKPGSSIKELQGGVLGGMVAQGSFSIGDDVEIRPGRKVQEQGRTLWKPIKTRVTGLRAGSDSVDKIMPGGSVGMLTDIDPAIIKSDSLGGSVIGKEGNMPDTMISVSLKAHLLERVVGAKDELLVEPIREKEALVLNVNTATTVGIVTSTTKGVLSLTLKLPIVASAGSKVTISRRFNDRWRLIGYGVIQ
ncbi:MAG: translation initiation factor IF-2 subunit gamma [Candidatus Woesearchaeota archaeon]